MCSGLSTKMWERSWRVIREQKLEDCIDDITMDVKKVCQEKVFVITKGENTILYESESVDFSLSNTVDTLTETALKPSKTYTVAKFLGQCKILPMEVHHLPFTRWL